MPRVRLGDTYRLPFPNGGDAGFDVVLFHQVLHYLDDPGAAVAEAARVMAPGGSLLIADFAPHGLEFLREEYAHRRLGFSDREVEGWFAAAGLEVRRQRNHRPACDEAGRRRETHRQAVAGDGESRCKNPMAKSEAA